MLARTAVARLYRGKTVTTVDPALVASDMEDCEQERVIGWPPGQLHLGMAYNSLLRCVHSLVDELRGRGVDLARDDYTSMLRMSNDTRELYETMQAAIVRAVGLRGIIRRMKESPP